MDIERLMKFNEIAIEVLEKGYADIMKAYKQKILENFTEFSDQEYASGLITIALNFSASVIYKLCKFNEAVNPEELLNDFSRLVLDGLNNELNRKGNLH